MPIGFEEFNIGNAVNTGGVTGSVNELLDVASGAVLLGRKDVFTVVTLSTVFPLIK